MSGDRIYWAFMALAGSVVIGRTVEWLITGGLS